MAAKQLALFKMLHAMVRELYSTYIVVQLYLQNNQYTVCRLEVLLKKAERLDDHIRLGMWHYYNQAGPRVHFPLESNPNPNTTPLSSHADIYNFALLDGRRITPTSRAQRNNAGSSIIQARINNKRYAGEIRSIFIHRQSNVPESSDTVLAAIEWMKRSDLTPLDNPTFIWDDL
jgi:hypothetical protein